MRGLAEEERSELCNVLLVLMDKSNGRLAAENLLTCYQQHFTPPLSLSRLHSLTSAYFQVGPHNKTGCTSVRKCMSDKTY